MSHLGNPPHVHVGKEPRERTRHDNMNWAPACNLSLAQVEEGPRRWMQSDCKNKNSNKDTAAKEDATDSTASMTKLVSVPTTVMAEKEDDTDSTATVTTAAATLVSASEWDNDIVTTLESSATWNEQICVFGKRRCVKPDCKWKTPTPCTSSKEKHTKLDKTVDAQSRKINGVFVFGCAAREITKNVCSLTTLQELSSPQNVVET